MCSCLLLYLTMLVRERRVLVSALALFRWQPDSNDVFQIPGKLLHSGQIDKMMASYIGG